VLYVPRTILKWETLIKISSISFHHIGEMDVMLDYLQIVFKIMCLHSSVMLSQLCCKYYTWKKEENTPSKPKPEAILKCEKKQSSQIV
jgi:hypothetical protein